MADGSGLVQLLNAVGELVHGAPEPTVHPVWCRELLDSQPMPMPTFAHREYDEISDTCKAVVPIDDMDHHSFFFGSRQIDSLRRHLPPNLRLTASTFDLLSASLWRARTIAMQPAAPEEEFRFIFSANARPRPGLSSPLPAGFYGNALGFLAALAPAEDLCRRPMAYAVELIKLAKSNISVEYLRSAADYMVTRSRSQINMINAFYVSDVKHSYFGDVDFGWGKPVYGGPAQGFIGIIPGAASFFIPHVNATGEKGVVVSVSLQAPTMRRFIAEIEKLVADVVGEEQDVALTRSAL